MVENRKQEMVMVDGYPVKQDDNRYLMSLGGATVKWVAKDTILGFCTIAGSRCRGFYTTKSEAEKNGWLYETN